MEPGRLLNSFMRFVESVRRNCTVKSLAQSSESGCDEGTGFRRGTRLRLLSAMLAGATRCRCIRFRSPCRNGERNGGGCLEGERRQDDRLEVERRLTRCVAQPLRPSTALLFPSFADRIVGRLWPKESVPSTRIPRCSGRIVEYAVVGIGRAHV